MNSSNQKWSDVLPVFVHILAWTTLLWMILTCLTLSLTMNFTLQYSRATVDITLRSQATSLAKTDLIHKALKDGACPDNFARYLDNLCAENPDITSLTIADSNCVRIYHVDRKKVGLHFVGGDQYAALEGESYFSNATGALGPQRRYFSPVFDEDGTVLGFVMAGTSDARLQELADEIHSVYSNYSVLLFILTLLLSFVLAFIIQSWLHTISPNELMRLYLTQTELLDNLDEGLMSVDRNGKLLFLNRSAENMLDQRGDKLLNVSLDDLILSANGTSLLLTPGANLPTSFPNILATIPKLKTGKDSGSKVIILKDKTELFRQSEQLNGTRHIIESLRANNHEFMNRLHVISGLLQIGRTEDALEYIGDLSTVNSAAISPVMQNILNPSIAALILGKLSNARERDISLTLLGGSHLPEHSRFLSTQDMITVIGNLLENAIEAVNIQPAGVPRSIDLQIHEDAQGLLIVVSDTGVGIPQENLDRIFQNGFSTKSIEGRGIGMALIRDILHRCNGNVDIETEVGSGTTFTLIFNQERKRK